MREYKIFGHMSRVDMLAAIDQQLFFPVRCCQRKVIGGIICRDGSLLQSACKISLEVLFGFDEKLNTTLLPLNTQYHSADAGIKQFAHYGQLIQSVKFRKFDYGSAGNTGKYDKTNSPDYNHRNIGLPVYLHYAINDIIADVQDVLVLYEMSPNAQKFLIPCDVFVHFDFVWGKNANTMLYSEILSLMERYRK